MCLLTNSEICYPTALSLKKSTLWIGDELRFVTVFQNKNIKLTVKYEGYIVGMTAQFTLLVHKK